MKLQPVPKSTDGAGYLPIISCTLRTASLEDEPEYSALSYVWGDPNTTRPILIDGKAFHVTVNLEVALRQLAEELRQRRHNPTWLWVDAICINQHDTTERTHQVCQMDQIYRRASRVVVWLGPSTPDSDAAIAALETVYSIAETSRTKHWVRSWPLFQFQEAPRPETSAHRIQAALDEVLGLLRADGCRALDAVAALFTRDWFRRVWVLQEVALAKDAVLLCGDASIHWQRFYTAFWMLCGLRDYLNAAVVSPRVVTTANMATAAFLDAKLQNVGSAAFSWVLAGSETPLRQFLYFLGANADNSRLLASDHRDYYFALVGLASDAQQLKVRVNYEKSWRDVRVHLAKACLQHYGLETLSHCNITASTWSSGEDDENAEDEGAPSWVPNWASPHLPKALTVYSHLNVRGGGAGRAYRASGSLKQGIEDSSFDANGRLKLWAIRVDSVERVGDGLPAEAVSYRDGENFDSLVAWLEGLSVVLPGTNDVYNSTEEVVEALWRTPIADRAFVHNYETIRAPQDLKTGYMDLLRGVRSREAIRYAGIAQYKLKRRKPFRTSKGFIGIGPQEVGEGDCLWIPLGADVPFVLREAEDGRLVVVGEAFVHGIMDGELTEGGSVEVKQIQLI
ncbi:ankyrin and het domain-containing protein [Diplodia corticola]|uniref:Ankyrin and het domain-containing protein n=1 Tax=Diplodia corticola TaxID=236234 RepID=A0A1J9S9W5_9PEZI|nr:ankyrin and het domain-containing protein [Diplodia corticola]OJD36684.1 ankyrin and het domain-containing protein [Diplodia corticola]